MTRYYNPPADMGIFPLLAVFGVGTAAAYTGWAEYLNRKYDFRSVSPDEAAKAVAAAKAGKRTNRIYLTTKARLAPGGTVQAYVKAAYIAAMAAQYLGNQGLAALAEQQLQQATKTRNSQNIRQIKTILQRVGQAILATGEAVRPGDRQVIVAAYTLGVSVRGRQRDVEADVVHEQTTPHARIDPVEEMKQAAQSVVDLPGRLVRGAKSKYDARAHRIALRKQRARRNIYLGVTLAVGLPFLAWAVWPRGE